jgi:hypothetical protein
MIWSPRMTTESPMYKAWEIVSRADNALFVLVLLTSVVLALVRWRRLGHFAAILSVLAVLSLSVGTGISAMWIWNKDFWTTADISTTSVLSMVSTLSNTAGVICLVLALHVSRGGAPRRQPAELPLAPAPYGANPSGAPGYPQPAPIPAPIPAQPGYGQQPYPQPTHGQPGQPPAPWTPPGTSD